MKKFLERVAFASEKAACVARACRKETDLFKLLVQEKETDGAEGSFAQDFKTLGDVLIQEMVRNDLAKTYPDLADHIQGEESNEFTNTLGEKICVKVCESQEETSDLLKKVLDGNEAAADILAKVVHSEFSEESEVAKLLGDRFQELPDEEGDVSDLGIWIDPIDGTNQYIRGQEVQPPEDLLERKGLGVVTILIGVFSRTTGQVVAGVVNQPFVNREGEEEEGVWTGQIHWGFGANASAQPTPSEQADAGDGLVAKPKAVISNREADDVSDGLEASGFDVVVAAGAGYKLLLVVLGQVDIYVTTKTYKWDTCAGQAILASQGGGMTELETGEEVVYNKPRENVVEPWANVGLIVAYRDKGLLEKLKPNLNKFLPQEDESIDVAEKEEKADE